MSDGGQQLEFQFMAEGPTKLDQVAEFVEAFGASRDPKVILKCIREEVDEMAEAISHVLKEACDVEYVCAWAKVADIKEMPQDLAQDLHTMGQYMSVMFHPLVLDEAFKRVHRSNMSKLGVDGKPIYREDGKVMKGPNYTVPQLTDLV